MTASNVEGPRFATTDDFPEILDLVDRCFHRRAGGMGDEWGHCYRQTHPEQHVVITVNGRVVSNVGCVVLPCIIDSAELDVAGITAVATDPRHRGNGYMTEILEFWLEEIDRRDIALSDLAGDRKRYGRYGWENGGLDRYYRISERSLSDPPDHDEHVHRYDGSTEDLEAIEAIYRTLRYRVRRDRRDFERHSERSNLETVIYDDGEAAAYLTFKRNQSNATVTEVAGDESAVLALLGYVFRVFGSGLNSLQIRIPRTHSLNATFASWSVSSGWRTVPHRKFNIRNLQALLEACTEQLNRRWASIGTDEWSISLGIVDTDQAVTLRGHDESIEVEATTVKPELALNRRQMTRLLFGYPETVRQYDGDPVLTHLLPLELYIPRTDQV